MNLDYSLKIDGPLLSLSKFSKKRTNYNKWKRSYRMCLLVIKHTISIRGSMPDKTRAKSFSAKVVDRFIKSDKVEASTQICTTTVKET